MCLKKKTKRSSPQVESRLNGEGAGLSLGINDPTVFFHLLLVFGIVWALFWNGQKDVSAGEISYWGRGILFYLVFVWSPLPFPFPWVARPCHL